MAIPLPAVTWRLRLTGLPRLRGRCAPCAAPSTFDPTGRFRVNANGKTIDVWLLLRCRACGGARKATVVERSPVRSIDPALLRRYHDNDPRLVAETLLTDPPRRRDRLTVDWDGAWSLDADPVPRRPGGSVTVRVELAAPVPVRPLRIIAAGLGISRAAAERLRADGRLQASTSLDARTSNGFSSTLDFTLDGPGPGGPAAVTDEPADGRNSRLEVAER
jgi:hypothetical protein